MRQAAWVMSGLLVLVFATAPAQAKDRDDMQVDKMSFNDLPGPVQKAISAEKGTGKVDEVLKVTRDGRTYYKARIDQGAQEHLLVVTPEGKIKSHWNVTDEGKQKLTFDQLPGDVKTALSKRVGEKNIKQLYQITRDDQTFYWVRTDYGDTLVVDQRGKISDDLEAAQKKLGDRRVNVDHGQPVKAAVRDGNDFGNVQELKFDELPAPVQKTINQYRKPGTELSDIVRVTRGDRTYFKARLNLDNKADHVLVIQPDGDLVRNWSADQALGQGENLTFDNAPGEIKATLGKAFGGRKIDELYRYRHGNQVFYRAHVQGQGWVLLDSQGNFVDEDFGFPGGQLVNFEGLPGPVKQAIGSHIGGNKVKRIYERRSDGKTIYYAEGGGESITVDASGNILSQSK